MATAPETELNMEKPERDDIKVNVIGVNHFAWLTKAQYQARRVAGEEQLELAPTGEDGVNQIRALL